MSDKNSRNLGDLRPGASGVIATLGFDQADSLRLMELGFIPGTVVSCRRQIPLGDLAVYRIEGGEIALRRETAARIAIHGQVAAGEMDDAEIGAER